MTAFSPDGRFFVSGSTDGEMKLWRTSHGQIPEDAPVCSKFECHDLGLTCGQFRPEMLEEGRVHLLATGGNDSLVKIWKIHVEREKVDLWKVLEVMRKKRKHIIWWK